ncbi:MAG: MerR family transcriptional regulator [Coprobacillus sp.]
MKTHELEEYLHITKQTLIYYEKESLIYPKRDDNGYRNYSKKDIEDLKFIIMLRTMDISIEEIKLIMAGQLSIRNALSTKQDFIKKHRIELDEIDKKIKAYTQRNKVMVSFDEIGETVNNEILSLYQDYIGYRGEEIQFDNIQYIDVSMSSAIGMMRGIFVYFNYYIDIDIHTSKDSYSFQIMNNSQVMGMFDYFQARDINMKDPIGLIQLYHDKKDPVALNKYLDLHFKKWAKQYHLDNPRGGFWNQHFESYKKYWEDFKKES